MSSIPLISVMPGLGASTAPDDLVSGSPILQALLSGTGGMKGLENVNSFGAMSPEMGQALSFMSPGGGLNPQQASQFGPMFGLLMSLMGNGQQGGQS